MAQPCWTYFVAAIPHEPWESFGFPRTVYVFTSAGVVLVWCSSAVIGLRRTLSGRKVSACAACFDAVVVEQVQCDPKFSCCECLDPKWVLSQSI